MGKPVPLCLDEEVVAAYEAQAAQRETSLSRHINDTLRAAEDQRWPIGFFDLFGSVDDPEFVRLDQPLLSANIPTLTP